MKNFVAVTDNDWFAYVSLPRDNQVTVKITMFEQIDSSQTGSK